MKLFIIPTLSFAVCTSALAEIHYVGADGYDFIPDVIYVNAGDTVHWDYLGGMAHTVTTGTDCFWDGYFHASLASFNPVVEWVIPMDAPSEIPYLCLPHCSYGMTAMIYVFHPCNADITNDDVVNVSDLLMVIDAWGQNKSKADISGDGIVDVTDLLEIVGNWGECP
jgi:plastocyanin